jgi:hypothetical protein
MEYLMIGELQVFLDELLAAAKECGEPVGLGSGAGLVRLVRT